MDKSNPIWQNLQRFANEHKVILEDDGEIGFGRPCVGFLRGGSYIAYNPRCYPGLKLVWPYDRRLGPPKAVRDAYHKGNYLAILVPDDNYDKALCQLNAWVECLRSLGEIEVVDFETGATGTQAIFSGYIAYAIRFKGQGNGGIKEKEIASG